jgi:hypothetical protein
MEHAEDLVRFAQLANYKKTHGTRNMDTHFGTFISNNYGTTNVGKEPGVLLWQ